MKKVNTSPLSGMQELLPAEQAVFNQLKAQIEGVYRHHGYQAIETPVIDRTEVLLAKAGGDTEKQVYMVSKTAESAESADQALRFDHTVPLARYVVEHEGNLAFPFKVTQIGRNFRGERAQRGRFREFYQCDVDVIGRGDLPIAYDADTIATIYDALQVFGLPDILVRVSNRKILAGFIESLDLTVKTAQISDVVDHAEKVPLAATRQALADLGLGDEQVGKVVAFTEINGDLATVEPKLAALGANNETFNTGVDELKTVLQLLAAQGITSKNAIADLLVVRGLDYYTGTVFEAIVPEHRQIGSISGGGRYDNLASNFTDQKLPGVGGSIGLTRLFYVLNTNGLLKQGVEVPVDTAIMPISSDEYDYAFELAGKLRAEGKVVDVVLTNKKLGDKLAYAAKIAKTGVVIGGDEVKTGQVKIKDFATGEEYPLSACGDS
ncbi:MAG: histidine--tRNA ligase [Candidatus Nomurabacteria bacterium]|jgi:histidyl-tRNA synthetase|nr:histidine--tRNA ligase [Candidatus Nomurabacteria bacterium]